MFKEKYVKTKEFIKEHKKDIIYGGVLIVISSASYVIISDKCLQNFDLKEDIKRLKTENAEQNRKINLIGHVVKDGILDVMEEDFINRRRAAECKVTRITNKGLSEESKGALEFWKQRVEDLYNKTNMVVETKKLVANEEFD